MFIESAPSVDFTNTLVTAFCTKVFFKFKPLCAHSLSLYFFGKS